MADLLPSIAIASFSPFLKVFNVTYLTGFERQGISICKNLFIAGVKPEVASKKLWDFLIAVSPFMSANDRDGLGYAAQSAEYGLWGERWFNPKDAWKYRKTATTEEIRLAAHFKGALTKPDRYNKFGIQDPSKTHAVLLHSRMATCDRTLDNVHPFIRGNTALVHNGVIRNDHLLKKITSTCDSECILNEYVDNGVTEDPNAIQAVAKALRGYYACGILTQGTDGKQYMDIFRNPTARLVCMYVTELDANVFCTTEEIVRNACKALKWTCSSALQFKDEMMIRLDAVTGDLISKHTFQVASEYNSYTPSTYPYQGNHEYSGLNETATADQKKSPSLAIVKALAQKERSGPTKIGKNSMIDMRTEAVGASTEDITCPFYYRGEGYNR